VCACACVLRVGVCKLNQRNTIKSRLSPACPQQSLLIYGSADTHNTQIDTFPPLSESVKITSICTGSFYSFAWSQRTPYTIYSLKA
jgi:hypothetical protein